MESTLRKKLVSLLAIVAIVGSALVVVGKANDAEAALKWREEVKAAKTKDSKSACDPAIAVCE